MTSFDRVDEIFSDYFRAGKAPSVVYGVVGGGELIHAGRLGSSDPAGPEGADVAPGDAVYRIASMTKSFTAAAVLLLRDEGRLDLDAPVADHVAELGGLNSSHPLTARHLLTMSGGLPTDDPWGDRQESLTVDAFRALVGAGIGFVAPPGIRFEYSNLGYAMLGRLVSEASGTEYREFVRSRLLEPLGLTSTVYDSAEVPAGRLVTGYRKSPEGWVPLPFDRPGVFSSIGGVYSSMRDIAAWMGGFDRAYDDAGAAGDLHPLSAASRREMQQLQRVSDVVPLASAGAEPGARAFGYGLGLFVERDSMLGEFAHHSGGYPGFGSHMRWHAESGLGVVAFANATYAAPASTAAEALEALLGYERGADAPTPAAPSPGVPTSSVARRERSGLSAALTVPWDSTRAAAEAVEKLFARWDDAAADGLFAVNMDLDIPREERKALFAEAAAQVPPGAVEEAASSTPAQRGWTVRGAGGVRRTTILMTPDLPAKVQTIKWTVTPE